MCVHSMRQTQLPREQTAPRPGGSPGVPLTVQVLGQHSHSDALPAVHCLVREWTTGEDGRDVTEAQSWSHPDSPWMMLALCQVPKVRGHQEFGAIIWAELMGLVVEQERFANSFGK